MIYAVTNRKLLPEGDFFSQLEKIGAARPDAVILREKDMAPEDYKKLAIKCRKICERYGVEFIINHFWQIGREPGMDRIHLSMAEFKALAESDMLDGWKSVGVSVHSLGEAVYAEGKGADYLIAGHIFPTDCKKDLPARGLDFLSDICNAVKIPVLAIGGMDIPHGEMAIEAGASGICLMSGLMKNSCPEEVIQRFSGRRF